MGFRGVLGSVVVICGLLCSAAPAVADPIPLASSGWIWGTPTPQGDGLGSVAFAGSTGYTSTGETVLRSDDSGSTWRAAGSSPSESVDIVAAFDATVIARGLCSLWFSRDGAQSWIRSTPFPSANVCSNNAASFVSADTGFVATIDGRLMATTDGGRSYRARAPIPGAQSGGYGGYLSDLHFVSSAIGFATVGHPSLGSGGKILRTADGGNTWTEVSTPDTGAPVITFANASVGYAVGIGDGPGYQPKMVKTTDGGLTWNPTAALPLPGARDNQITGRSINCSGVDQCIAVTGRGVFRTDDGGASFQRIDFHIPNDLHAIRSATFVSPSRAVAVGLMGGQFVSDDGGASFRQLGDYLDGYFWALRPGATPSTVFAVGSPSVARSTDAGKTWKALGFAAADVSFATPNDGYAVKDNGEIFRSRNGGTDWISTGGKVNPRGALLSAVPEQLLAAEPRGLRRSQNGGRTFHRMNQRAVANQKLIGFDRAGSRLLVFGAKRIATSSRTGSKWKALRRPVKAGRITGVDFVSTKLGYATGSHGSLWKTRNGGKRWREVRALPNLVNRVAFSSSLRGYAWGQNVGASHGGGEYGGQLFRTSDGGSSWHQQIASHRVQDVIAPGGGTDYSLLTDPQNGILRTTSGGDAGLSGKLSISVSRRKLRRGGQVTVSGRLTPGLDDAAVDLYYRSPRNHAWIKKSGPQGIAIGAGGTFKVRLSVGSVRGRHQFMATWSGDGSHRGVNSKPVTAKVTR